MKKLLFLSTILGFGLLQAQDPIFNPSMAISSIGVVDSPAGEGVANIIDGSTATKFLDFALEDGMGFSVDLGGISAIVNSIEVVTANDFPVRDPMNWEIKGSNDGSTFVTVDTGVIDCIPDRFFSRTFDFDNGIDFQWYEVNFTNACDPSGGTGIPSIQLAEVQLYGAVLGIDNLLLDTRFTVYPNPAQNAITIDYTGSDPLVAVNIYDLLGKRVMTLDISGFDSSRSYELSKLTTGIYFVRLKTLAATSVKRILKN